MSQAPWSAFLLSLIHILLELSDGIVDIVETGTTLKENGLEVYEYVSPISARVIVNPVSMKLKKNSIEDLIDKMESNI